MGERYTHKTRVDGRIENPEKKKKRKMCLRLAVSPMRLDVGYIPPLLLAHSTVKKCCVLGAGV